MKEVRVQRGRTADKATQDDVLAVAEPVRRVIRARVPDASAAEDVVQETLVRLLEVRERLDRQALVAYGVVVARNLVASDIREAELHARHEHRLVEPPTGPGPEEGLLDAEEAAALRIGLQRLPAEDRDLLLAHEVGAEPTGRLAAAAGTTPGAIGARLARARARLRVDHLLALRRVELPTDRCRPVLDALSLGDGRQQQRLRAGNHLLECPTCAALSEPLVQRSRSLAALLPVPWLAVLGSRGAELVRGHPLQSSFAVAGTAGAVVVAVVLAQDEPPPEQAPPVAAAPVAPAPVPAPAPAPVTLTVAGAALLPAAGPVPSLAPQVGAPVVADRVSVESVPADEGFWVGTVGARVWVQLSSAAESPPDIQPGAVVSFTGTLAATAPDMPGQVGVTPEEGAEELVRQGAHAAVDPGQLTIG